MGLTTRPPGAAGGAGVPELPAPVPHELAALVEELRTLAGAAPGTPSLPPLPGLRGAAPELALARWFRSVLEPGTVAPPALRELIERAVERLGAARPPAAAGSRPLENARDAALRLLGAAAAETGPGQGAAPAPAAPGPADLALALRVLAEEVRRAVVLELGSEPPYLAPPAAAEDPGNAGAALLGWLRAAAARAGVPLGALAPAVEAGAANARALLPQAAGAGALAAALEAARAVVARGLGAAGAAAATAAPGPLAVLVAEIATSAGERLAALAPPPAVSEDPAQAAEALLGWLRAAAVRGGAGPPALSAAVAEGTERALASFAGAGADPAARAAIELTRAWIDRGLAAGTPAGPPALLYRPDVPGRPAGGPGRSRPRDGGERVLPIGAEERPPGGRGRPGGEPRPEAAAEPAAENPTEGPMQCIRRCVDALYAGDGAAFSAEWLFPACFWVDGRWLCCADEAELAALQERLLRAGRERGVVTARLLLLRVDPVSEAAALVHALIGEARADGSLVREAQVLYTTLRSAGGWRVAVAIAR
ncbi:MAG TPA: hypothetical protein VMU00_03950 [Steroidobacteraceae bacterium]|nr:hypothetical protein [Steroidobacteraceae bacterium]